MKSSARQDQSEKERRTSEIPEVSFVVPSYRSRETIGETLAAIFDQKTSLSFEALVVDSSPGDLRLWIKTNCPGVRLVGSEKRLYPGAARNLGALHAKGRWLAFVDADAAPRPDWLETLHARLRDPRWKAAGGWIGNANPQKIPSRILHWIEFSECLPGRLGGARTSLSSSNLLMAREIFLESGGFPEDMAMAEDLAFSARLGGGLYFEGGTGVLHRHRESWPQVNQHLQRLGYWSGRLRKSAAASGSWLARAGWLTWLLPFYRAVRITGRAFRARPAEGLQCLLRAPDLLRGLFRWARGFRSGLAE